MKLEYQIDATRPASRRLTVRVRFEPPPLPAGQAETVDFFLPAWTPGSYLIRDYARHLSRVVGREAGTQRALSCRKIGKNRFRVDAQGVRELELSYSVYAHELSVRTADVDAGHAYWNHACVLLWPVGFEELEAHIVVQHPRGWAFASPLAERTEAASRVPEADGGVARTLIARGVDEAIDSPCLAGTLQRHDWQIDGVPHAIVLDGVAGIEPPASLVDDLTKVIRCAAAVFGGRLPYDRYLFLALFADQGHGGLEHRESSTLLMGRTALADDGGYREFLALAAHEAFHAWNGKRMRPVEFWRYDYEHENHTGFLWLIEGWTAYYDDLLVARAGLMTVSDYLATVAKHLQAMANAPGRFALSLEESSHDAWIRLYRPDEHTRNSSQNYYGNGAVAALCLDLEIRRATGHAHGLDDVLRRLYAATFGEGRGYGRDDVERSVEAVAGPAVVARLRELVTGDLDPDVGPLLAEVGVLHSIKERDRPHLGVTFHPGGTIIAGVTDGTAAHDAGLAPGDEVLAIRGLRVQADSWRDLFRSVAANGRPLEILVARRGVVTAVTAVPRPGVGTIQLALDESAGEAVRARRQAWLGAAPAATTNRPDT